MRRGASSVKAPRPIALGALALAILLGASATGCGYRLAGHNQLLPPQIKTIGILPFTNTTRRPEVEQRITEQVTQSFISRGGYRAVATASGADAVLKGEVTGYDSNPVKVGRDGRATAYEVIVTASVELKDATTDKVYFRSDHFIFKQQYDVSRSASQFIDTEIVAINDVAHDFAESVVTSILEGF